MFHELKYSSTKDFFSLSASHRENFSFPPHFHENYEFIYVTEGLIQIDLFGNTYNICAGDGALVLPNQPHAFHTPEHSVIWIAIFSPDHIPVLKKLTLSDGVRRPVIKSPKEGLYELFLRGDTLRRHSALYEIAAQYIDGEKAPELEQNDSSAFCRIIEYVEQHFTESITLSDVSADLGYNYRYMSGIINKAFKLSLPQIISRYRVNYARELLTDVKTPITEIALLCGFGSMRSFNRNFKEIVGVSPSEYRAENTLNR